MNNPYAWNTVNPQLCYGRDALLSELLSGLPGSPRYSFGLAGGRRMGKTTLLRRVETELRTSTDQWRASGLLVIPLYIDGLTLPRPMSASAVWGCLLSELQIALPDQPLQPAGPLDFNTFKQIVQPVLSHLPERPRVVVMFDEIEPIVVCEWAYEFLGQWRALLSNTPGLSEYFTAVFAGAQEMAALQRDVGSPLKDILEWHSLRDLEYEDACWLMQEPIERKWPEAFLTKTYDETGGHPMLLQYVMQHICASPPEMAEHSLEQATAQFLQRHGWQFGEWWGRYCTPTAQRVYARLPDDGSTLPLRALTREFGLNEANDALEVLQHVGLAAAEEEGFAFRYSGEMFRRWYRVYGTLAEVPQHDPELYARLGKIGPELADKYLSAWKIYQVDLPNYSGAIGEMRDTLSLLLDKIAPDDQVSAQPDFRLEPGQERPTRRQRVRYAVWQRYSAEHTREIISDFDLLEIGCDQLAQLTTGAFRVSSGMTHVTATRDMAYRTLKQWDSILAQLVPSEFVGGNDLPDE
jgi:hypothetical protein